MHNEIVCYKALLLPKPFFASLNIVAQCLTALLRILDVLSSVLDLRLSWFSILLHFVRLHKVYQTIFALHIGCFTFLFPFSKYVVLRDSRRDRFSVSCPMTIRTYFNTCYSMIPSPVFQLLSLWEVCEPSVETVLETFKANYVRRYSEC
jgi:hypothetical protein